MRPHQHIGTACIVGALGFFSPLESVNASPASCTNGNALLQADAQAWTALKNQLDRYRKNISAVNTAISNVVYINKAVGLADKTAKEIGDLLFISNRTVEKHKSQLGLSE